MARLPRLIVPNQPHHVIQRGNDQQWIFREPGDYEIFLGHLRDAAKSYRVAIHAYVLMSNHIHLLVSPSDETGLARMMQWIGRQYVPYFNRKYHRVGTLWQGRYKATVIDTEKYFMACSRYIELNPVRGGLAVEPLDYRWSSYAHHVGVKLDAVVTDHALYWSLGNTPFDREMAYREMVKQGIDDSDVAALKSATSKGWALGSDHFKKRLEKQIQRRVSPVKRGRPAKKDAKKES